MCFFVVWCAHQIVKTSRGKSKYQYGEKVGTKPSRNNPCTNGLVHYSVQECKQVVWSYNLEAHFEVKHTKIPCHLNITQVGIVAMQK